MLIKTRENTGVQGKTVKPDHYLGLGPFSYTQALMLIKTRENTGVQGKTVKSDEELGLTLIAG